MDDPALEELKLALARFCDEVLSDVTIPTQGGLLRRVHWLHQGREFRASLLLSPEGGALQVRGRPDSRPPRSLQFDQLPSRPVFEQRTGGVGWENARNIGMWRWMLRTAGRPSLDQGDDAPGDLAGRPVRPRPGLPSLGAGAAALPEPVEYASRCYRAVPLTSGGRDDERGLAYQ